MGESNGTRRAPRKLSAEQQWEVFLQVTVGGPSTRAGTTSSPRG